MKCKNHLGVIVEPKEIFISCFIAFIVVILCLVYFSDKKNDSSELDSLGRNFDSWKNIWESQR